MKPLNKNHIDKGQKAGKIMQIDLIHNTLLNRNILKLKY